MKHELDTVVPSAECKRIKTEPGISDHQQQHRQAFHDPAAAEAAGANTHGGTHHAATGMLAAVAADDDLPIDLTLDSDSAR